MPYLAKVALYVALYAYCCTDVYGQAPIGQRAFSTERLDVYQRDALGYGNRLFTAYAKGTPTEVGRAIVNEDSTELKTFAARKDFQAEFLAGLNSHVGAEFKYDGPNYYGAAAASACGNPLCKCENCLCPPPCPCATALPAAEVQRARPTVQKHHRAKWRPLKRWLQRRASRGRCG